MKYCTRCLYPENHPLNIIFNEKGVCSGCLIHEEKDIIDWNEREIKLKTILNNYKNTSGKNYDCIIPVSGSRDSFFIVHMIKNVYGMNPLLVNYNKHYNTPTGIRNLSLLRTIFNSDIMTMTISPEILKKITKASLLKMGSIYWHCLAGTTVFPVQIASKLKIPLIIWGVHQGCDQVGMFSHLDEVEMTRKYRKNHDLMGFEAEDLVDETLNLNIEDVRQFIYPYDKEIEKVGIRGIYLSNYIRWDTKSQHEKMINLYSYETLDQNRTFDSYNDVDCFHYSDLHDYIKFCKWGYGKVTDHTSREIRLKRMTREEGVDLVREYQNKPIISLNLFNEWLGTTKKGLQYIIDIHRDPRIWERDNENKWILKDSILSHLNDLNIEEARLEKVDNCEFIHTPSKSKDDLQYKYTLIGKGFNNNYKD